VRTRPATAKWRLGVGASWFVAVLGGVRLITGERAPAQLRDLQRAIEMERPDPLLIDAGRP